MPVEEVGGAGVVAVANEVTAERGPGEAIAVMEARELEAKRGPDKGRAEVLVKLETK